MSYRDLSDQNLMQFDNALSTANFDEIYSISNVDNAMNAFIDIIVYNMDVYCPVKKRYPNFNKKNKQWVTYQLKQASVDLKNLYWLCRNIGGSDAQQTYITAKSNYSNLIKNSKKQFHEQLINKSNNKPRTTWNLVNKNNSPL